MASSAKPALEISAPAAKIANPAPLGLAAFGVTTVVLSSINAGLLPASAVAAVVPLAFAFGGVAQLITGILEYANGNTFGTVAFTSYGAFWCWYSLLVWTIGAGWIKPPDPAGVGTALAMWGVFTFYLWVCTFKSNKVIFTTFLFLWITFFLLASGDYGWALGKKLGGIVGLATGVVALYASFAEVLNATFGKEALPLGKPIL
ncbi:MAG TPA: acetate uptake transporter [Terriglobales bacterium]|nr:acetate uptake transporter [Terriglobales bacterium]